MSRPARILSLTGPGPAPEAPVPPAAVEDPNIPRILSLFLDARYDSEFILGAYPARVKLGLLAYNNGDGLTKVQFEQIESIIDILHDIKPTDRSEIFLSTAPSVDGIYSVLDIPQIQEKVYVNCPWDPSTKLSFSSEVPDDLSGSLEMKDLDLVGRFGSTPGIQWDGTLRAPGVGYKTLLEFRSKPLRAGGIVYAFNRDIATPPALGAQSRLNDVLSVITDSVAEPTGIEHISGPDSKIDSSTGRSGAGINTNPILDISSLAVGKFSIDTFNPAEDINKVNVRYFPPFLPGKFIDLDYKDIPRGPSIKDILVCLACFVWGGKPGYTVDDILAANNISIGRADVHISWIFKQVNGLILVDGFDGLLSYGDKIRTVVLFLFFLKSVGDKSKSLVAKHKSACLATGDRLGFIDAIKTEVPFIVYKPNTTKARTAWVYRVPDGGYARVNTTEQIYKETANSVFGFAMKKGKKDKIKNKLLDKRVIETEKKLGRKAARAFEKKARNALGVRRGGGGYEMELFNKIQDSQKEDIDVDDIKKEDIYELDVSWLGEDAIKTLLKEADCDDESNEEIYESEFKKLPDHVTVRPSLEELCGFRDYFDGGDKVVVVPLFVRWAKNDPSANGMVQKFQRIIDVMQDYSVKITTKLLNSESSDILRFFVPKTTFEEEGTESEDIYAESNTVDEDGFYIDNPTFRLPFQSLFFQIIQKWHPELDEKYIDIFMINNGYLKDEPIVIVVKKILHTEEDVEITDEIVNDAISKVAAVFKPKIAEGDGEPPSPKRRRTESPPSTPITASADASMLPFSEGYSEMSSPSFTGGDSSSRQKQTRRRRQRQKKKLRTRKLRVSRLGGLEATFEIVPHRP